MKKLLLLLLTIISFLHTEEIPCECDTVWLQSERPYDNRVGLWQNGYWALENLPDKPEEISNCSSNSNYTSYWIYKYTLITTVTSFGDTAYGYRWDFKKYYCCPCTEENTEFPTLTSDQNTTFAWSEPDNKTSECSDINGIVQEIRQNCKSIYRCVVDKSLLCDQNDTDFPKLAENTRIIDSWTEPEDRSTQCIGNSTVEEKTVSCKKEYRCVTQTEEAPKVCDEQVSSYVSPRNGTFHEDIALTGVDFGLHYDSSEWNSTSIAHGWSLSSHARLKGNKIYFGSGSIYAFKQSTQENNLTVVIYGSREYLFDANGRLQNTRDLYTKETDMTFSYDALENLVTVTDNYGEITTIERDSNATVTSITAPHGQSTYLAIDAQGDLVEVQYEDTSSYAFEYERHLMTVETEPNGNRFLHFFDDAGKVVKVIDAEQGEWNFGSTSADTYGSHTVTRASGDVIIYKNHFLENNTTLRTEKVLPTGDVVEYSHSIDDSTSSTLSCGLQSTNIYKTNTDGSLFKDPYTNKRVLESSTVVTPSGLSNTSTLSREYLYQRDRTLKHITNTSTTNSKTSQHIKNFKRHRSISISPEGKRSHVQYDPKMQNPLHIKAYGLHKTMYEYDTKGRVTKETTGKRVTTYSYTARGNLQSITDPLGRSTSYTYDSRDRVIQSTYADGSTEAFEYDANGNQIKRTVPTPADHTFTYNGVNKRVSNTSPLQKSTTYTYDKQRRVTKITKPSTKTIDTVYTNGRVSSVTTPEGTTNYTYACQSNVNRISKGSENFSFTYDGTLLTSSNQAGVLNQSIAYTYNNDFLPTSMTYANQTENYSYNQDNQPTQIGSFSIVRTNKDRNITVTDGSYSKLSKVNGYGELKLSKDNALNIKLKRNLAGQIVKKVETLQNNKKVIYHYTYDERGRLTEVKNRKNIVETYTYDSNGNRATATVNDTAITASYTLDDNLIVYGDNTYRYDDDGYLEEKVTPDGSTTYSYGTLGELIQVVTPTQTITYTHNANNQRVSKEVNGTTVEKYLWADLTTLLAVYDKDDNLVQRFEYADQRMPVAITDGNGTKYYLHYDQVGSLRAVSDTSHNVIKEITYDTFGNILSVSNETFTVPFGFAGGLYDTDTKLTRFGYRDYDAYTGKWTAKDPIGFSGGDSNLYGYVLGDPVNFVDPEGLFPWAIFLGGVIDTYFAAPWVTHARYEYNVQLECEKIIADLDIDIICDGCVDSQNCEDKMKEEVSKIRNTCLSIIKKHLSDTIRSGG